MLGTLSNALKLRITPTQIIFHVTPLQITPIRSYLRRWGMWWRIVIHSSIHSFIRSFIHSAICLTRGPQPLPKPVLHTVRSSASSFNLQYPIFSLRSSSSCLRLLPRLPAISILSSICPSIMCFKRQFLSKLSPIQLTFFLCIVCRIFILSLALYNTSPFLTLSVQQNGRVECFWHHSGCERFSAGLLCGLNGMIVTPWVCSCLKRENC